MKYSKLLKTFIQIILLCFVAPSYQLVNETVKGNTENVLVNKINKVPNTKSTDHLIAPPSTQKTAVKTIPVHITPQPLITGRKVVVNPIESAKLHKLVHNDKKPIGVIIANQLKPKLKPVVSKHIKSDDNSEAKTVKHEEKPMFSEETEDIFDEIGKNKADKSKENIEVCKKSKIHEASLEINTEEKSEHKVKENEDELSSGALKTQESEDKKNDDFNNSESQLSGKDHSKHEVLSNINIKDNMHLNETENCSINETINLQHTEKVLKITNLCEKEIDESTKDSDHTNTKENSKKNFLHSDETTGVTKLDINVDPKVMEKLTNDASDKIFIKNYNFEELHEKYDFDTETEDKHDLNKNPYVPDATFIKEPYNFSSKNQIEINNIGDNQNVHGHFTYVINNALKERIWRAWKNYEIHVKSNTNKNKSKNKQNYDDEVKKEPYDCYNNAKFEPVYDNAYNTMAQDLWHGSVPAKSSIRYYSPSQYSPSLVTSPNCYRLQSYGYQYAPVSSYQKYIFPCI